MAVIILVGIIVISLLARSMIRKREPWSPSLSPNSDGVIPTSACPRSIRESESKFEPRFEPKIVAPLFPPAPASPSVTAISASSSQARVRDLATHLSPASRAVVQQLGIAITAQNRRRSRPRRRRVVWRSRLSEACHSPSTASAFLPGDLPPSPAHRFALCSRPPSGPAGLRLLISHSDASYPFRILRPLCLPHSSSGPDRSPRRCFPSPHGFSISSSSTWPGKRFDKPESIPIPPA